MHVVLSGQAQQFLELALAWASPDSENSWVDFHPKVNSLARSCSAMSGTPASPQLLRPRTSLI